MKHFLKLFLLNASIAVAAVVVYSPGLLALRPTDPSILRAGCAILIGLALAAGLLGGNYRLLREPQKITRAEIQNAAQAETALKAYFHSAFFGDLAKTAADQLHRVENSTARALRAVNGRFQTGSMSANRYAAIIEAAGATALENIKNAAVRMQMFDDNEYKRLKNYKNDDIPDEIQEQQIALYEKNIEHVKNSIAANERLVLKMDTLALELSGHAADDASQSDALLGEITQLTEELQYYKD